MEASELIFRMALIITGVLLGIGAGVYIVSLLA